MAGFLGGLGNIFKSIGGGAKDLLGGIFGSGGGSASPVGGASLSSMPQGYGGSIGGFGGSKGLMSSLGGGINKMFTGGGQGGNLMQGLTTILGSQMIGNPKAPALGQDYQDYMSMMKGGGTPGMQSANQYYQNVLSGQNQGAYDAATSSLDESYADEERKLHQMYKSLRPGSDPTTDSTYQRDLSELQGNYAKQRALAMAGVQQGAAQGASQVGGQQMQGMQSGIQAQIDQIAQQWGMNYQQRDALRKMLMGVGGYQVTGPQSVFGQKGLV